MSQNRSSKLKKNGTFPRKSLSYILLVLISILTLRVGEAQLFEYTEAKDRISTEYVKGVYVGVAPLAYVLPNRQIQVNARTNISNSFTLNGDFGVFTRRQVGGDREGYRIRGYLSYNVFWFDEPVLFVGAGVQYRSESVEQNEVFSRFDGLYNQEYEYRERVQHFGVPLLIGMHMQPLDRVFVELVVGGLVYEEFTIQNLGVADDATLLGTQDNDIDGIEEIVFNIKVQYKITGPIFPRKSP